MALSLLRTLGKSTVLRSNARSFCIVSTEVVTSHTDKWMQDSDIKFSEYHGDIDYLCENMEQEALKVVDSFLLWRDNPHQIKDKSKKSPMQLINEVPPIKVEGRIVACEGSKNPLGHPIEFICLDLDEPAICKYCGLRYVQDHGHHH